MRVRPRLFKCLDLNNYKSQILSQKKETGCQRCVEKNVLRPGQTGQSFLLARPPTSFQTSCPKSVSTVRIRQEKRQQGARGEWKETHENLGREVRIFLLRVSPCLFKRLDLEVCERSEFVTGMRGKRRLLGGCGKTVATVNTRPEHTIWNSLRGWWQEHPPGTGQRV